MSEAICSGFRTSNGAPCHDLSTTDSSQDRMLYKLFDLGNEYHACQFGTVSAPRIDWVRKDNLMTESEWIGNSRRKPLAA